MSRHKVEGAETYKRMVSFLYLLMRDHLSMGKINDVLKTVTNGQEAVYSDGVLLAKAESVAQQLGSGTYEVKNINVSWGIGDAIPPEVLAMMQEHGDELAEWFNKHNSVTEAGPTEPPTPFPPNLDDANVKVAGDEGGNE